MTAVFNNDAGLVNAMRTQRRDHPDDILSMILAIGDQGYTQGRLEIAAWGKSPDGDMGLSGMYLSIERVRELARAERSN
jgi:hypothetical protein